MGKIYAFSVDREDDIVLTKIKGIYPRMRFSRLINMMLRQWLEQREKKGTKDEFKSEIIRMIEDW